MAGELYNKHVEQVAGLFKEGRRYALGIYFGLSPSGELISGAEQDGEILPNLVHPDDKGQISYLLNLDSMSTVLADNEPGMKGNSKGLKNSYFEEALDALLPLSLEEQNAFVRRAKVLLGKSREEDLLRYREEIAVLQTRCEAIVQSQKELEGI